MFATQSIPHPQGVSVFGSHLIRTEPDYASVRFTASYVAGEPKEALEQSNAAAERIHKVFAAHSVAEADVQSSRVRLELAFSGYGERRKKVGYEASRGYQVFVRDLDTIEEFLVAVVDAGGKTITSVSYKTSQLRELRRQAREGAVAAARSKGELYASAAGASLGAVLHIEDVNPDQLRRRSHAPDIDLEGHSGSSAGTGSITISGAVMLCFALISP